MLRKDRSSLALPRLPSLFSKSIGLTLWGIVEDPISPALVICSKFYEEKKNYISWRKNPLKALVVKHYNKHVPV